MKPPTLGRSELWTEVRDGGRWPFPKIGIITVRRILKIRHTQKHDIKGHDHK